MKGPAAVLRDAPQGLAARGQRVRLACTGIAPCSHYAKDERSAESRFVTNVAAPLHKRAHPAIAMRHVVLVRCRAQHGGGVQRRRLYAARLKFLG